ncbi:ATP-binding cassette transporter snq2 [Lithohypha guttulata]|uniref:ABC multidrug transporter atrF n=1 Tax=Lithohypha guttulata TaxID=1690604 RepID=A0AAN7T2Z2_9EURO|nr:ATP-binding cassette transporter snq2 [Lithohypha guttulata]
MWGQTPGGVLYRQHTRDGVREGATNELHNTAFPSEVYSNVTTSQPLHRRASSEETPQDDSSDSEVIWGERDVGRPISTREAMADYEEMRRELTQLNLQRTKSRKSSHAGEQTNLFRTITGSSLGRQKTSKSRRRSDATAGTVDEEEKDVEAQDGQGDEDFDIGGFLKDGHFEKRTPEGHSAKRLGVLFKDLTVKGVGASMIFTKTVPDAILGTFGPDLYRIVCRFIPALHIGKKPPVRTIINNFTGAVRAGEMMLVLGRPGSGCSTFLKVIANKRDEYAEVIGEVNYGGIPADEQKKHFNGEVNYNPEDDQHLPSLTVWQTLSFALMNKTKKHDRDSIPVIINSLLKMFGIEHTKHTLVGNEYVRGVSGGERKRVSIAETLATKSSVVTWDNSTRGLDSSTAIDYVKSLRIMTDVSNRTTFVSLYQAGQGIYDLFDSVLVIEEGRMIYQGLASRARQYFEDLGFFAPERMTTSDFLTSVGDPTQRRFQEGKEASTPKTAEELETAFRKSDICKQGMAEVDRYEKEIHSNDQDVKDFTDAVAEQQSNSKLMSSRSSYTVSFPRQVWACTKREFDLFWNDKTTIYTKLFIIIANGLIVGSLFYGESFDTSGAFSRGGALFFSILFLGWLQLSELMKAVSGRTIINRHKDYAFYRPSAVVIARVVQDVPILAVQAVIFTIILYWMSNLAPDAGKFFINLLFVYTSTFCITALYRMFAALSPTIDDAVRFSGTALNILIIYVGYIIPKQTLLQDRIWFGWLFWTNPVAYAYEAVLTNEFNGRVMDCSPSQLVPAGPGLDPQYQSCALTGSQPGSTTVTGENYYSTSFSYSRSNLWRDFGALVAFTILYILVTAIATELFSFTISGGGALIFKKTKRAKNQINQEEKGSALDEEKVAAAQASSRDSGASSETVQGHNSDGNKDDITNEIAQSKSVFTWENVSYTVPYQGGTRQLLNGVNGYVKPGIMIALMGASGAGKTTLLNTLSQRQTMGVVSGDMLVDGQALGVEFQRGTGFCEQMDLHEMTASVREAFEFSALLRQSADIPREEKIAYVDRIIELLELEDIQDALLISLGVEQRKRVTIGVELAAKPQLLLFLDEPTSGLDSQAALSITRFLKKLAHAGQAIICTIHQPSSVLIQEFDMVVALNPGGNPFYFGPIGENGSDVIKYFAARGVECPPGKNVAEFLLETAAKGRKNPKTGKRINWNEEWKQSEQNKQMLAEIQRLKESRSKEVAQNASQQDKKVERQFAAPVWTQTYLLTKRNFIAQWRDPSYLYGKIFVSAIIGIVNGFTFYNLANDIASLQSRLFSAFLILFIPPTIVNAVVPKFYMNRSLWEAREHPSRIYNWFAFCTAQIVPEIPWAIIGAVVYFLIWYYPANLPRDSSTAGYVFLMSMLWFFFQASWGQWICAFAPDFTVISNVLPFFFVMVSLFNGVVRPYEQIPAFWRYWMYWINPSQWWIGGVLAATLGNIEIRCAEGESTVFNPPPGQTCGSYAGPLVANMASGYITNPEATANCGYCQYANGAEYLATLNIKPGDKWRDFGIFLVFVISNWALVYFFIYTVRVKGFTFGMGPLFGSVGKGVGAVKNLFQRKKKGQEQE